MPREIAFTISLPTPHPSPAILQLAMAKEAEGTGIPFTDIQINLTDQTITLKREEEVVATLVFAGKLPAEGVIFLGNKPHALRESPVDTDSPFAEENDVPVSPAPAVSERLTFSNAAKEKEKTVTLSGKLKSQAKPGRNDRSGKPTAYADFAAHVDGEEQGHYYKATFHRHTREIALKLPAETPITVTGYPHPSNTPKRKDTFSVVNIVEYPGKPPAKPKKR